MKQLNRYLWENMDPRSRKESRRQWSKGELVDAFTWNLDAFFAKVIYEYLERYVELAGKIIEISQEEIEAYEFIIYFFKKYYKYDFEKWENYEEEYDKAFGYLAKYFHKMWW